jgi:hypothetical protein
LGLVFLVDFFEVVLLIRDFFVIAIVVSQGIGFELLYANLCGKPRAKPQLPSKDS